MNFYELQNSLTILAKKFTLIGGINLLIIGTLIFIFPLLFAYILGAIVLGLGISLIIYSYKLKKAQKSSKNKGYVYQETIYYHQ